MSHFPLSNSALCEDCGEVGDNLRNCACCGSRALMPLAPLLNRETGPTVYEVEQELWKVEVRELAGRIGMLPALLRGQRKLMKDRPQKVWAKGQRKGRQ